MLATKLVKTAAITADLARGSANPRELLSESQTGTTSDWRLPCSSTDFSRVPAHREGGRSPEPASARPERSIEGPAGEEQTADAGPGTGSGAGAAGAAAATCDCVPSQVEIKNVSSYRSGDLYGHQFDVEISLTYLKASPGTTGQDAQLIWREKTDRPPAWQGLAPNTWNDMFALFPGSPTFAGWTSGRSKPCPGTEVAKIVDPPAANVHMPARTLEFDIYAVGSQVSHNARAKQVLEPDGSGGIRTQTFEVLPSSYGPLAGP